MKWFLENYFTLVTIRVPLLFKCLKDFTIAICKYVKLEPKGLHEANFGHILAYLTSWILWQKLASTLRQKARCLHLRVGFAFDWTKQWLSRVKKEAEMDISSHFFAPWPTDMSQSVFQKVLILQLHDQIC